tara:strand:- start:696 stop:1034 length:339 start_codon:yes stop_codon:yes gene_type:complete
MYQLNLTARELGLVANRLGYCYCDLDENNAPTGLAFDRYGKDAVVGAFRKVQELINDQWLTENELELSKEQRKTTFPIPSESAFGIDRDFEVLRMKRKDHNKISKRPTSFYM